MNNPQFSIYQTTCDWLKDNQISTLSFDRTDSTNTQAKKEVQNLSNNLKVYLTNEQTAGRGRGENIWLNPKMDDGLLITWSFALHQSPQPLTSLYVGLAVYKAFQETWGDASFRIKPPNDIF